MLHNQIVYDMMISKKGEQMLLEERLSQISQIVDEQGSATIDFLAQKLEVSKDTIRRDLMKLESRKNCIEFMVEQFQSVKRLKF